MLVGAPRQVAHAARGLGLRQVRGQVIALVAWQAVLCSIAGTAAAIVQHEHARVCSLLQGAVGSMSTLHTRTGMTGHVCLACCGMVARWQQEADAVEPLPCAAVPCLSPRPSAGMRRTAPRSGGTRASRPGSGARGSWCTGQWISVSPPGPRQRPRTAGKTQRRLLLPHLGCCSCLHSPSRVRAQGQRQVQVSGCKHSRPLPSPLGKNKVYCYIAHLHWLALSALCRQL